MTAVDLLPRQHTKPNAPSASLPPAYIMTVACPDRLGVVAEVARFLVAHGCNIIESGQFTDQDTGHFFLRNAFNPLSDIPVEDLERAFRPIAESYEIEAHFYNAASKVKTLVMVSKLGHCLNDLIYRHRIGSLPIEIVGVVSNHSDFREMVVAAGLPFYHLPVTPETKLAQEEELHAIARMHNTELIVLARYMQVLSPDFCSRWSGRIINIHHSFLPSFKGALPYRRAHDRGVKLIGATGHYVTDDLDEGPIIEQDVLRVSHSMNTDDLIVVGRDVESVVLARAIKWHSERRVLLNGVRTIIFR